MYLRKEVATMEQKSGNETIESKENFNIKRIALFVIVVILAGIVGIESFLLMPCHTFLHRH